MFDKDKFANLLTQAKGARSMRAYAMESDLSPAHLSRLSRSLLEAPPSPETLKKLAMYAQGGVSLKGFMEACGYYEEPKAIKAERHGEVARLLYDSQDKWSVRRGERVDYELYSKEGVHWEWIEGGMPEEVYGRLAILPPSTRKRSIVVRSREDAKELQRKPPLSLAGEYTIVLLEESGWAELEFNQGKVR